MYQFPLYHFALEASSALHLSEVAESEVVSIINGLESKKASGFDGIPLRFIKAEPNSFGRLVTRLVNSSITPGIFPDLWKLAVVTPIQKAKLSYRDDQLLSDLCSTSFI